MSKCMVYPPMDVQKPDIILYSLGDQKTSLTGGWEISKSSGGSYSFGSDAIYLNPQGKNSENTHIYAFTTNAVEFNRTYAYAEIAWTTTTAYSAYYRPSMRATNKSTSYSTGYVIENSQTNPTTAIGSTATSGTNIFYLELKNQTGNIGVGFSWINGTTSYAPTAKITKVWLSNKKLF